MSIVKVDKMLVISGDSSGTQDNTTEGFIPKKTLNSFENSAISETDLDVNVSKELTVPVGTINLGGAYSISSGGESVFIKNSSTGVSNAIIFQSDGSMLPSAFVLQDFNEDIIIQADKSEQITNPAFIINSVLNNRIFAFSFEAVATIDNVVLEVKKSGELFFSKELGTLLQDVETKFDLLAGKSVPIDIFEAVDYEISLSSQDGDVVLKGDEFGTPFYRETWWTFEEQDITTADLPINQEVLIDQSSTALTQAPSSLNNKIRIEFGPAFGGVLDPISMDVTGLFTCNISGTYFPKIKVQFGKGGGGGESDTFISAMVDGVQVGGSIWARLDDAKTVLPLSASSMVLNLTTGQTFEFMLWNDDFSGGTNDGRLEMGIPDAVDSNDSPSSSISVSRLVGNAGSIQGAGDVEGPPSASTDEIATYANVTGKKIKSNSGISALNSIIKEIGGGEQEISFNATNISVAGIDLSETAVISSNVGTLLKFDDVVELNYLNQAEIIGRSWSAGQFTYNADEARPQMSVSGLTPVNIGTGDGTVTNSTTSVVDEIATYSNGSGLYIKSTSDIQALNGSITRTGSGNLKLQGTSSSQIELNNFNDVNDVLVSSTADVRAGINVETDSVVRGGLGYRSNQFVMQPHGYETDQTARGVVIETTDTQTRVEGIKHYIDNGIEANVIESAQSRNLKLRAAGSKQVIIAAAIKTGYAGSAREDSISIGSSPQSDNTALSINNGKALQVAVVNETQRDALVDGSFGYDAGKIIFNVTSLKLEYHDGTNWIALG